MNDSALYLLGGGGHAKVLLSIVELIEYNKIIILDDDEKKVGKSISGYPIQKMSKYYDKFIKAVVSVGNNKTRKEIVKRFPKAQWTTLIHPHSYVHSSVEIGKGSVICAGVVIQPDVRIGEHVIVNTGATIDHDNRIQDFVHIAPGVHTAGKVTINEGTFLGIGSSVVPCKTIGAWSTIGAGAVVICDIPRDVTAVGIPAEAKMRNFDEQG